MNLITTELRKKIIRVEPDVHRLDAAVAPEFKRQFQALIDDGHTRIVLDLNEVNFVDSSGLGAIVAIYKRLKPVGKLVILTSSQAVLTMFKLTRLEKVFTIISSKNMVDAINYFK